MDDDEMHIRYDLNGDDAGGRFVGFGTTMTATSDRHANLTNIVTTLVDGRASGHYIDDQLILGLEERIMDFAELENPREVVVAGEHVLLDTATGTITGISADRGGKKHPVKIPGSIVSGLGRHLLSSKEVAKKGIITVIDKDHYRLHMGMTMVLPLQQLRESQDIYSLDVDLTARIAHEIHVAMKMQEDSVDPSTQVECEKEMATKATDGQQGVPHLQPRHEECDSEQIISIFIEIPARVMPLPEVDDNCIIDVRECVSFMDVTTQT